MAILTIKKNDGTVVALPDPSKLTWDKDDIDSEETTRNQLGDLFRDRVASKRKIECSWPPLPPSKCSTLLKAVKDQFFQITYPDAEEGTNRTMTAYVGTRSAPMYSCIDSEPLWEGLNMNFIER
mgnify:CR=1 FL=1